MKVRIVYTYEVDKEDYSKMRKFWSISRIRDFIFGGFIEGGNYAVSQEIYNQIKQREDK